MNASRMSADSSPTSASPWRRSLLADLRLPRLFVGGTDLLDIGHGLLFLSRPFVCGFNQ
jgi:hypothetical protein